MRGVPSPSPELGLRRVSWVRVTVGDGGVRYEAVGLSHRRPATRAITLATALQLAARGVPVVTTGVAQATGAVG